jgi:ankyrin repeat protein
MSISLCCISVLNEASVEQVEELVGPLQANINKINRFGLTALMFACRIRNSKMLHLLLRNGASLMQKGNKAGLGRTAL